MTSIQHPVGDSLSASRTSHINMRVLSTVILAIILFIGVSAQDFNAVIVQSANNIGSGGNFAYGFESSNGILLEVRGRPAKTGGQAIDGRFAWTAPDKNSYAIQFTADENGYQPIGAHLPTPPPIPYAILRSIDYNDRHPEQDDSQRTSK